MKKPNNVISLQKEKKQRQAAAGKHHTMCKSGHHKWKTDKSTVFDTQLGKLVTRYECRYCGISKTKST